MYVNFDLLISKGLDKSSFLLLQACSQNKTEDLGVIIENNWEWVELKRLETLGLIEYIKGTKNQSIQSKARISTKGRDLLDELETPLVTENDLKVFDWLEKVYKGLGKEVGNRKKTKMYIALFRVHSQIDKNKLAVLINSFLKDDNQLEYSIRLEYLFFKPANMFQVRFDIEQSRLYQYYLKHQETFDKAFKQYED